MSSNFREEMIDALEELFETADAGLVTLIEGEFDKAVEQMRGIVDDEIERQKKEIDKEESEEDDL